MELLGVVVLSIFGYYAVGMLASFRRGMLERGWRMVTVGAIILALAQIPFLVASFSSSPFASLLMYSGNISRFIGIIFLIVGFRDQYRIWRPDRKNNFSNYESNATIER